VVFRHKLLPVTDLVNVAGVVLVVPRECQCDAAVQNIVRQAGGQRLQVWLIADGRSDKDDTDVNRLADGAAAGPPLVVDDPDRLLASTYKASGLTAVLVRTDRIVRRIIRGVQPGRNVSGDLRPLQTPS
jgi:hypothetical protein